MVAPDYPAAALRARREPPGNLTHADIATIYAAYDDRKTAEGLIDFEDVLLLTVGMLDTRPDIVDEIRSAYRWFTVDEYQDVNPLQQRLLELWLGDRDDLCVVGDASQTIYTFTGASSSYLVDFRSRFPHATEVRLVRSYRSTPQVVALANRVLASATGPEAKLRLELRATRADGPEPVVRAHDDEPGEASAVAKAISALIAAGTPAREMAILYRINAQSEVFEEALAEASIPYVLRGESAFFQRGEVREAVTRLRGAARGGEVSSLLSDDVRSVLSAMGWAQEPPSGTGAVRERWENLLRLVTLADDLAAANPEAGLADLVADLDLRAATQAAPTADGVTLSTVHAAKGLEWDAVFVVGLVQGTFPIQYADTPARLEEERRLFYVACTRARVHLGLSWARSRAGRGRRERSPFLDAAFGAAVEASGAAGGVVRGSGSRSTERGRRRGPAACKVCGKSLVTGAESARSRCRECPASYDEDLFDRLKAWRKEESERRSVPAYVVFRVSGPASSRPTPTPCWHWCVVRTPRLSPATRSDSQQLRGQLSTGGDAASHGRSPDLAWNASPPLNTGSSVLQWIGFSSFCRCGMCLAQWMKASSTSTTCHMRAVSGPVAVAAASSAGDRPPRARSSPLPMSRTLPLTWRPTVVR